MSLSKTKLPTIYVPVNASTVGSILGNPANPTKLPTILQQCKIVLYAAILDGFKNGNRPTNKFVEKALPYIKIHLQENNATQIKIVFDFNCFDPEKLLQEGEEIQPNSKIVGVFKFTSDGRWTYNITQQLL